MNEKTENNTEVMRRETKYMRRSSPIINKRERVMVASIASA
jgi:hypothetical protein